MTEEERKEELTKLTGGLKCRCPGRQVMTRVQCKGFNGVRYCYYVCADSAGAETMYPVGDPVLCRCSLGTRRDNASERFFNNSEANWGFARCYEPKTLPVPTSGSRPKSGWVNPPLGVWLGTLGVGFLIWQVTKG